jgi:hypothetical protein
MLVGFVAGIGVGIIASIVAAIAILHWPPPERTVAPKYFAAVADRPMLHPGSSAHGALPHDWSGPVWNPPRGWRPAEVPYRIIKTELDVDIDNCSGISV